MNPAILFAIIIILAAFVIFLILQLKNKDNLLKELQSKESELDYKLSKIRDFKVKVEKGLHEKIQQTDNEIAVKRQSFEKEITHTREHFRKETKITEQKLTVLKSAAEALRRKIEGYGDEYIIPKIQLIDELAENYNLEHAGNKLKECRAAMRQMIKQGNAATGGGELQSKILLEYFTGATENLIENVKHENYGKLKQEMADIYALCNYYAAQFANLSQIAEPFYQVRQDELKWASIVHTMRMAEREEQREIREKMREEERAKKEYERAIKEAAKEEAMLQKAMEKAKAAYDSAGAEQKAKYEQQLEELTTRLKEAEEKNKRALSMAQQTRAGHVYLISNIGSFGENMMKIGMTRRLEPLDRVRELGDASVPFLFDVHAIIYSDDAPALEKQLHKEFADLRVNKVNHRKEFFRVSASQVKSKLDELGINAQFTLAAQAEEYRETLRIENMDGSEKNKILDSLLTHEYDDEAEKSQ